MSSDNVKKLQLGISKAAFGEGIPENASDEELQQLIDEGMKLEEEALKSGDIDVLTRAFDYFLEESVDNGLGNGVCESLENDIFRYYQMDQIINVLKSKLSRLIELNIERAAHFVGACDIEEVKELIQTLPVPLATTFLIELKDSCRKELAGQIASLL